MLNITSGGMSGGYKTYLSNIIPRLKAHPEVEALMVALPQSVDPEVCNIPRRDAEWLPLNCRVLTFGREIDKASRCTIDHFSPDVVFIPTARYWPIANVPVVNMVQNMKPMMRDYAVHCMERIKNWARFQQMRKAVGRANRIIAVSTFVKEYLTCEVGVAADRVGVVHHGIDRDRRHLSVQPHGISDISAESFVFTAGLIYPYRGLEDLIEAWSRLRSTPDLPLLVIAGKVGHGMSRYHDRLVRMVHERGLASHIRFVGLLTREEMAWCYRNSLAFAMTSRVEACPNIALEAMAHGCPCISTHNPPMPEMFAEAAEYYPAGDADQLADRIRAVVRLSREEQRAKSDLAVVRAASFSWDSCCDRTVEELKKALQ